LEMAVVKDKHIKMKPIIYALFLFDLDGDCKFIKNRTFFMIREIYSWLTPWLGE